MLTGGIVDELARRSRETYEPREEDTPSLRSCLYLSTSRRNRHDMQGSWRLASAQRAGAITVKETWTAEAGCHQDGTGSHGILG